MDFLLSSCLTQSCSKSNVLHTRAIYLLVILSILIPVHSHMVKRASTSTCDTAYPGNTPIDILFCSPNEGEEYQIGQNVNLSWNPSNANLFGSNMEVEVYLFRKRQNATTYEEIVVLNPGNSTEYILVPRKDNSMNFTVESRWLPDYKYSTQSENSRHTFVFRVIPKGSDKYDRDFSTPEFIVIGELDKPDKPDTATPTNTASILPTLPPTSSSIDSKTQKNDKSEDDTDSAKKAFIAVIAVASAATFLAFIAIVIAIRSRKRVNSKNKQQSLSNLSTNSRTPMISVEKDGNSNRDPDSVEAESIHSTTPFANKEVHSKLRSTVSFSDDNPISASDAALLSDAFRKVLRQPDWKPEDEDDDDINLSQDNLSQEERLRRREAKELMKKELAEEGTDLQNITKHTKVEIHNISGELEKDGNSQS